MKISEGDYIFFKSARVLLLRFDRVLRNSSNSASVLDSEKISVNIAHSTSHRVVFQSDFFTKLSLESTHDVLLEATTVPIIIKELNSKQFSAYLMVSLLCR